MFRALALRQSSDEELPFRALVVSQSSTAGSLETRNLLYRMSAVAAY